MVEHTGLAAQPGNIPNPTSHPATSPASHTTGIDYQRVVRSPEFVQLKRRYRGFVLPVAAVSLGLYVAFVVFAIFAPREVMGIHVFGFVNLGFVLGLGQFLMVFLVTIWYVSYANRRLDPLAEDMRERLTAIEEGK